MTCKKGHTSGLLRDGRCAECSREQCRSYYAKKRKDIIAQKRTYQAENAESISVKRAEYREKNREALREDNNRRYRQDPEVRKLAAKKWRESLTPEQRKAHDKKGHAKRDPIHVHAVHRAWLLRTGYQWHKVNPEAQAAKNARRRTKINQAEGTYTADDVKELLAKQKNRCACCGAKKNLAVDHIVPLTKGGSNWPRNLQMLCKPCNSRKAARDPIEFMQSIGALL